MIGAPVPGVVNALQVTIPGRSPSVPSIKALGNARDEKKPTTTTAAAAAAAATPAVATTTAPPTTTTVASVAADGGWEGLFWALLVVSTYSKSRFLNAIK